MKEQIQKLRRQLDAYYQIASELKHFKNVGVSADFKDFSSDKATFELVGFPDYTISKEVEIAAHHLVTAKAWTGKLLGFLGNENPYKNNGNRTEVAHIEPAADVVDIKPWKEKNGWDKFNPVEKVDKLRELIQTSIEIIQSIYLEKDVSINIIAPRETSIARTQIEVHLIEARFQLGYELARLREEPTKYPYDYTTPLYGGVKQR